MADILAMYMLLLLLLSSFSFSFLYKVDSSYLPIDVNVADPRNVEVMLYWIAMKAGVQ